MLDDEILKLRQELNESVLKEDQEKTYELSVKLDKLISNYYKKTLKDDKKKKDEKSQGNQ